MGQVAQSAAPGAQAAETLRRRWSAIEQNADREAETIRDSYRSQREQVAKDPDLVELAKRTRGDELREQAKEQMVETRRRYEQALRALELEASRVAFGAAPPPSKPASLQAWRDSVDRVDRASPDRAEALAMMRQAVRSGDRGIAAEIARRASERGWGDVVAAWDGPTAIAAAHRELAAATRDGARNMFRWSVGA